MLRLGALINGPNGPPGPVKRHQELPPALTTVIATRAAERAMSLMSLAEPGWAGDYLDYEDDQHGGSQ